MYSKAIIAKLQEYTQSSFKLAVTVLVVMGIIYGAVMVYNLRPGQSTYLTFENVYFERVDNETLHVTVYITNDGLSDSHRVKAIMYVTDSQSLSQTKSVEQVGVIRSETTEEVTFTASVIKDQKYSVEVLIFDGGKLTLKGSGTLQTYTTYYGAQTEAQAGTGYLSETREQDRVSVPGFEMVPLTFSLLVAVLVYKRRRN